MFAGLLFAGPAAAAQATCNPSINPSGTPAPGTVVAPGLRVVSTQWGLGNCPEPFFVSSRASDGTTWATDFSNGLWKSTDDLRTLTRTYSATGYSQIEQVLPLSSGTVLIVVRDASGNRHILRSTDSTATSFSPVLDLPAGAFLLSSNSWTQLGGAVYIGEYQGGPPENLYKSTDDGRTWSVVYSATQSDEIHTVQADPYVPGRLWMMLDGDEDGLSGTQVGYSDDGGSSWTWVTDGSYPESRVVGLMFDSNAVYWGTDSPDVPAGLFRYDRSTHKVTQLMNNLNGPFYAAVGYNGQFAQFSAVEPATHYIGDQNIHVITNGDGTSWSETTTPWSRDQTKPQSTASPVGNTQPDSQGRFWLAYYDLAGSQDLAANIELQFDPTAKYTGLSSSFTAAPNPFTVGQSTSFDGSASSSSAPPLSYQWNFGDGATASGSATTSHAYSGAGPFTASLQVNDANKNAALSTLSLSSQPQAPTAATGAAPATATSASLYGDATPNGSSTSAYFQYGTSTSYGSQTSTQSLGSGTTPQSLNATVTGLQPSTTYHYRLVATNGTGTSNGIDRVFTTPASPTSATTNAATNIGGLGATANGTVNPAGLDTTVYFQFGTSTSYGSTSTSQDIGSGSSAQATSTQLTGLSGNTTYHYRVVAVNQSGTYYGADQSFATLPPPPAVGTNPATFANSTGATLNASVNPNGGTANVWFEYGTSSSYGSQTSTQNIGTGTSPIAVNIPVTGLQPNTTYHYRVDASNQNGTTQGADATFTTTAGPPVVTTGSATGVNGSGATVAGTVDPQGLTASTYFQYGTSTSYGSQSSTQTLPGNIVPNPGCGNGTTTGWIIGGTAPTTFAAQNGWASVGPSSCRFTTGTIASGGYSEADVRPYISGVSAAAQYAFSADLNVLSLSSAQKIVLYAVWRDASGNSLGKVQVASTTATGLITLSGSLTAPAGTAQGQVDLTVEGAGTADMYFDNVNMTAAGTGTLQNVSAQLSGLPAGQTYHYRTVATTSAGTSYGPDQTFTTQSNAPPIVGTTPATFANSSGATLNASVTPNGSSTNVWFEYGTTSAYGSQTSSQNIGSGLSAVPINLPLSGLQPYTTYHYRIDASNQNGTVQSADGSFTTTAGPPVVTTGAASGVTGSTASLSGTVDPQGQTTSAYFQYGTDTSYGSQSSTQMLPGNLVPNPGCGNGSTSGWVTGGTAPTTFAAQNGWASVGPSSCRFTTATIASGGYSEVDVRPYIANVTAGTQYSLSADLNVLSLSPGQKVVLYATWRDVNGNSLGKVQAATTSSSGLITLSGPLTAPAGTTQGQVYITVEGAGNADLYFDNVQMTAAGTGTLQNLSAQLSSLTPGQTYHYRTVATSAAGTSYGPDQTFTTPGPDTTPPSSSASAVAYANSNSWSVSYTAADNPGGWGLAEVDLYAQAPGQSGYSKVASDTSGHTSGSFNYIAAAGDGSYNFYTVATDQAGNTETAPASPEASTLLDTASPTSTASSPSQASGSSWSVNYTASDNQGGSGLAEVDLYAKAPGQTGYTEVGSIVGSSGSGNFTYTATGGDGSYSFYTLASDQAGNTQATPASPQTTTLLDTTPPSSSASSPSQTSQSSWSVNYTATDTPGGSGLAEVDLYAQAPGQSGYSKVASDTTGNGSGSFSYAATAGDGSYSFYTVATDQAGNVQAAPTSPQATTLLDTTPPSSSASAPSQTTSSSWSVAYTASDNQGGSGLAEVDLYAKAPGQTSYTKVASDTSGHSSGNFSYTATAGDGTYSFYTVATDATGNSETSPANPDTTTVLDTTAPSSSASSPSQTKSSSWSVAYTASDNQGGSGLAEVDLYAKAPGQTSYSKVASDTSGHSSGTFSYTATAGSGTYSFYTLASDQAGNTETAPAGPDTTTLLDATAPSSSASSPATTNQTSWSVSYTASDNQGGSGLAEVDLYAKAPGQTSYTKVGTEPVQTARAASATRPRRAVAPTASTPSPATRPATPRPRRPIPTRRRSSTRRRLAPRQARPRKRARAAGRSHTRPPITSGGSGLAEVDLYAKAPGQTSYSKIASDTSGHGSGSFTYTATAGLGTYSFYTLSTDKAGNTETPPAGPDTTTSLTAASTSTTVTAPSTDTTNTAIAASSIGSALSGANANAGGSITFKVFGPQSSAPNTCTTGGTTVGTASVSGNGTYHPSAGFTPSNGGTYWWYASYGGDSTDAASNSGCGNGMTSTTVASSTSTNVGAPTTGIAGSSIGASSISSALSSASSNAGGSITFKVFGPQATAPTTCTTGGTTVGTASVSGNGTYHPSSGFTPSSAGDYWWYASYNGDSNNSPSNSGCGSSMGETVVYSASSVANATDTSRANSTTTSNFTVKPNTTYLLLVFRNSSSGDSISSISSTGLSPALSTTSFTSVTSQNFSSTGYQWAYYVSTGSSASGTGNLTVKFNKSLSFNQASVIDLIQLGGNSTSAPIVTTNEGIAKGTTTTATANLPSAPASADAGLVFLGGLSDLGTSAPTATPALTSQFYSHQSSGSAAFYTGVPAVQNESLRVSFGVSWGTLALEIRHG